MRHAAAVPASKAKIGAVYAVERDGELERFCVTCVTTHRIADNGGPADYESEITGCFQDGTGQKVTIRPNQLLGRFEEYQVLVEKREAEKREQARKEKLEKDEALELRRLLYQIVGEQAPNDPSAHSQLFRVMSYSGGEVDLSRKANRPLLDGLRKLMADADAAHSSNVVEAS